MKFQEYRISPEIKKSLDRLGFKKPTDIQFKAIGPILKGDDVLAIAQTGTGKTGAFVIPVLDKLFHRKKQSRSTGVKCIVMAPTRELAQQITDVFNHIGKHVNLKTLAIYGGVDQDPQITKLIKGTDIVVATPGRLFDLVSQKHLELSKIQILVLDEADHMLDLGFYNDIKQLIKHLPKQRQTLFFSATINEEIKKLAYSLVHNPIRIQISPKDPVSANVEHSVAFIEMDDKRHFLARFVNDSTEAKILVFVRTKVRAERVKKALEREEILSETIHGNKTQHERQKALNQFRTGSAKVLIATDVSARGIDIPDINYVINYDLPDDKPETYVHRVGRTGRGTKRGVAISFCSSEEKEMLNKIENFISKKVEVLEISKSDYRATIERQENKKSEDLPTDFRSLMKEAELEEQKMRKHKKKKK